MPQGNGSRACTLSTRWRPPRCSSRRRRAGAKQRGRRTCIPQGTRCSSPPSMGFPVRGKAGQGSGGHGGTRSVRRRSRSTPCVGNASEAGEGWSPEHRVGRRDRRCPACSSTPLPASAKDYPPSPAAEKTTRRLFGDNSCIKVGAVEMPSIGEPEKSIVRAPHGATATFFAEVMPTGHAPSGRRRRAHL